MGHGGAGAETETYRQLSCLVLSGPVVSCLPASYFIPPRPQRAEEKQPKAPNRDPPGERRGDEALLLSFSS